MIQILSFHQFHKLMQKQSSRGVPLKRCPENIQQIYKKTQFIEIVFLHGCSPVNLLHICKTFPQQSISGGLLLMFFNPSLLTFLEICLLQSSKHLKPSENIMCKIISVQPISIVHENCPVYFKYLNETLQNNQDELLTFSVIFLIKILVSIFLFKLMTIKS